MNHPHSDQRVHPVWQCRPAFGPHTRLVNASVSPLDHHPSALIPSRHNDDSGSHPVVDGEVITNTLTISDTNSTPRPVRPVLVNPVKQVSPVVEPERGLLRRVVEDPYWILVTLMATLGVTVTATVVHGLTQITLRLAQWLHVNSGTVAAVIVIVVLAVCAGATTARCAGIHCAGCQGHRS